MPATKRGIFHNLKESNYTVTNSEIVFFFSSKLYRKKFLDGYKENRKNKKFIAELNGTPLNLDVVADIMYYQEIEKRGFLAWLKGVEVSCEELHRIYALRKMTDRNTLDWYETQRQRLEERIKTME